ncbi:TraB/GumN family protein [uncultured Shewanella sp.]|uniref:TraB/GumN family protein n=1 Tax=uncultured Shewanella sp. TaxID=173975 RepID=UPI002607F7DB|nr:TraB/GumN family protein [uncultured Shewanella sp.]
MAISQRCRFMYRVLLCLSFFCASSLVIAEDKPLLYKVNIKGKTAYLFGSIHIGQADFYPLPRRVTEAFSRASGLVVEAKPDNEHMVRLLQKYGRKPYALDERTALVFEQYCQDRGDFCATISTFSPWLQALQISLMRYGALGLSSQLGVDVTLMEQNGQRPLYELESAEEQLALLASFSEAIQWQMLEESIKASDEQMLLLVSAWRKGDARLLSRLIKSQLSARFGKTQAEDLPQKRNMSVKVNNTEDALIERLLWQRNQTMASNIERLLNAQGLDNLFVVVGVGHLVGDRSIQSELIKQGASIKNCWQEDCLSTNH